MPVQNFMAYYVHSYTTIVVYYYSSVVVEIFLSGPPDYKAMARNE